MSEAITPELLRRIADKLADRSRASLEVLCDPSSTGAMRKVATEEISKNGKLLDAAVTRFMQDRG